MAHEDPLDAILEVGRRTRSRPGRWQWIAALVVGGVGAIGFAIAMLAAPAPAGRAGVTPSASGGGSGGLWFAIGVGVGLAVGVTIPPRQRRDHSSRSSP